MLTVNCLFVHCNKCFDRKKIMAPLPSTYILPEKQFSQYYKIWKPPNFKKPQFPTNHLVNWEKLGSKVWADFPKSLFINKISCLWIGKIWKDQLGQYSKTSILNLFVNCQKLGKSKIQSPNFESIEKLRKVMF